MSAIRQEALQVADLSPTNFAIVMATGILGVAAQQQGHATLSAVLLACTLLAWVAIGVMTLARLVAHPHRLLEDLRNHQRAPGFLTAVAGTSVLGSLWLLLGLPRDAGVLLDAIAALLWLALTYGVLMALTLEPEKPPLAEAISGSWLLVVVATQSVAVLTVIVAAGTPQPARLALNFAAVALWLCGSMLYVWVIALIFYRFAFLRFTPQDLAPTSWINMGAMAISTLAGALLVANTPAAPMLAGLLPVLKGGTVLSWAVGTWWIPLLAALAVWRYGHRRHPLRYDVAYWGVVFPLGMYSAATEQMALALDLPFLRPVASTFFLLAAAAWLLTSAGLLRKLIRSSARGRSAAGRPT